MPRLRRADCSQPGLTRRKRGRGFVYLDSADRRIADERTLARIRALAIPPAWRDVWICPDPRGHLQATGLDIAGRKQYRYHDAWRARRDREKFDSMLAFAAALPRLRRRVRHELRDDGLARERVLACAIRLLDLGYFRVGSDDALESYGLTTIRREQVRIEGGEAIFDYTAKGGKRRIQAIRDADVVAVVHGLRRRRAHQHDPLLVYRDGRRWVEIRAETVNEYLKLSTGGDFSAKDFRTWNATVLAAVALAAPTVPVPASASARKRTVSQAVRTVAAYLGNTPTVARNAYIDPRVIDRFQSGWTIGPALAAVGGEPELADEKVRRRLELAVVDLLTEDPADAPSVGSPLGETAKRRSR